MKSKMKFIIFSEDKDKSKELLSFLNKELEDGFSTKNDLVLVSEHFVDISEEILSKVEEIIRKSKISYALIWFSDAVHETGLDLYNYANEEYTASSVSLSLNSNDVSDFDLLLLLGKKDYIERVFYGI